VTVTCYGRLINCRIIIIIIIIIENLYSPIMVDNSVKYYYYIVCAVRRDFLSGLPELLLLSVTTRVTGEFPARTGSPLADR